MKLHNRSSILSLAAFAAGLAVFPTQPAHAAGAGVQSEALIVRSLSLVKSEDLDWGTLVASPLAGTVTINAVSGARSVTGGVAAAGGTPSRAEFVGAGRIGVLTIIALSASPTLSNGSGGTMSTLLQLDGPTLRILPGTGAQTIGVGGILAVGANQAAGDYSGTFTLTVNYL